jgi:transposase
MRPHGSAESLEFRRREAVRLHESGLATARIAHRLGTTRRSIDRWLRASKRRGIDALRAKQAPGRPPKLTGPQKRALAACLLKGALAAGYPTDLWTCPRIGQVIRDRFGMVFHVDYLPRLMRSLGFSCQRPERRALEQDERALRRWIERDWPRIKKKPPAPAPI